MITKTSSSPIATHETLENSLPLALPKAQTSTNSRSFSSPELLDLPVRGQHLTENQSFTAGTEERQGPKTLYINQIGLPAGQKDTGSIVTMVKKFCSPNQIGEFLDAISSTPRVKRHNTASWISGNIKPNQYSRLYVPVFEIRAQHSIDGKAIPKTKERAELIYEWLEKNPHATEINLKTLSKLANSDGVIKVGFGGDRQFVALDGTGRIEAIRLALALFTERNNGEKHPMKSVETFAVKLSDVEFSQLKKTSDYFLDELGNQRDKPVHDLMPFTAIPRLVAGTSMNLWKHHLNPDAITDRRIPIQVDTEKPHKD